MLEEAVVNVIRYGYEDDAPHQIQLAMEIQEGLVIMRLVDDGREFDPCAAPSPDFDIPHEERPIGGLGIHLMRELCECMTYERVDDRNRLTLQVPRPGGGAHGSRSCPCT